MNTDLQYDAADILFDEEAVDLAIGPADADNVQDLLEIIPGELRNFPTVGWAAAKRLNGILSQEDIADANQQLSNDGYPNFSISFTNGVLTIVNNS